MSANSKVILIDKGASFLIRVQDRSYGGVTSDLLRLDGQDLNLLATGDYLLRGVPVGHGTPAAEAAIQLTSDRGDTFDSTTEEWGRDWLTQFDLLPPVLRCRFCAAALGNGTYRIRVGGTVGQPDGTVVATLTITDGGDFPIPVEVMGPAFGNPGGFTPVKLTGTAPSGVTKLIATSVFIEVAP